MVESVVEILAKKMVFSTNRYGDNILIGDFLSYCCMLDISCEGWRICHWAVEMNNAGVNRYGDSYSD